MDMVMDKISEMSSRAVFVRRDDSLLSQVLSYSHPKLIDRMVRKSKISSEKAEGLFEDTKKFLYLCGASDNAVLAPTEEIDECWHQFLLYTEDYPKFCQKFFGAFIHHSPMTPEEVRIDEGKMMRRTEATAIEFFGEGNLSENWVYATEPGSCGSKCGGSSGVTNRDDEVGL